jgi:hypothetical protein
MLHIGIRITMYELSDRKKNKKAMVVTLHLLQDIQSIMRDWGLMDYNIFY